MVYFRCVREMALRSWVGFGVLVFLVAAVLQSLIIGGHFEHVYNHRPGKCIQFPMNGSEDMTLLPNNHVLMASGTYLWQLEGSVPIPDTGIFMFDLNDPAQGPKELLLEGDFQEQTLDFIPHGVAHWITEDGSIILYVINHRRGKKDFIESFFYNPDTLSLKYRKSFSHALLREINDLVLVGLDELYVSNDHYFNIEFLKTAETYLRLPFSSVVYYNDATQEVKTVAKGLKYANGVAISNNRRFIYVSNMLQKEINAYTRNPDNSLELVQTLPLQVVDNIFVSPTNGHLWLSVFPTPLQFSSYAQDHSTPMASITLHVTIDEDRDLPFSSYEIEEVFSTTGHDVRGISISVYHNKKLLLGSIFTDMMYCEVPFLMYQ